MNKIETIVTTCHETLNRSSYVSGDSVRLFHGRGQCFDGLNGCCVDWFSPVVLITVFEDVDASWLKALAETLNTRLPIEIRCIVVQRRNIEKSPFDVLVGQLPESVYATRGELKFNLSFTQQNVGYFLDIEPARKWLTSQCEGKKVLNLFSYTCAFSVVAIAAKATSVVNIDLSRRSLNVGRENHLLNELPTQNVHFFAHDIFKSWGKLKKYGPYDIVIIDPPSFQKGSFIAKKDYAKVLKRMESLVAEDGQTLACLNSPEVTRGEFLPQCSEILFGFEFKKSLESNVFFPEKDKERGLKLEIFKKVRCIGVNND